MHNSRRPTLCDTVTFTFDRIFIGGRGIVMEYPCAKCGDLTFTRFGFIVRTNRQTDAHRITEAAHRLTHAIVVVASNYNQIKHFYFSTVILSLDKTCYTIFSKSMIINFMIINVMILMCKKSTIYTANILNCTWTKICIGL